MSQKFDSLVNKMDSMETKLNNLSIKSSDPYASHDLDQLKKILAYRIEKVLRYQNAQLILEKHKLHKNSPKLIMLIGFLNLTTLILNILKVLMSL